MSRKSKSRTSTENVKSTKRQKKNQSTQKKNKKTRKNRNKSIKKKVIQPLSMNTLYDKLMEHLEHLRTKERVKQPPTFKKIEVIDKKTNKPVLVLLYAQWCDHCQRLMPQWNEMKNHVIENNIYSPDEIKEIESKEQDEKLRELNENYMIDDEIRPEGYPTMGKIVNGRFERYQGERDTPSLIRWAGGETA